MGVGNAIWLMVLTALFVANMYSVYSESHKGNSGLATFGAFAIGCVGFSIGILIGGML